MFEFLFTFLVEIVKLECPSKWRLHADLTQFKCGKNVFFVNIYPSTHKMRPFSNLFSMIRSGNESFCTQSQLNWTWNQYFWAKMRWEKKSFLFVFMCVMWEYLLWLPFRAFILSWYSLKHQRHSIHSTFDIPWLFTI